MYFWRNRKWSRDNKSQWQINGRKAMAKDISKLVDSLNIQVAVSQNYFFVTLTAKPMSLESWFNICV